MEIKYRKTKTTISFLQYHFIFCSRNRRKIFVIPGVKERFRELIEEICNDLDIKIISIKCHEAHVDLIIHALPDISPTDIMQKIKSKTSTQLRTEFSELNKIPSLWTRKFLVSSVLIDEGTIQKYIREQRTR